MNFPQRHKPALPYDFAYGRSDLDTFPFQLWRRLLLKCARQASIAELYFFLLRWERGPRFAGIV